LRGVSEPVPVYELRLAQGESRGNGAEPRRLYA
jgi:hypothetical protein